LILYSTADGSPLRSPYRYMATFRSITVAILRRGEAVVIGDSGPTYSGLIIDPSTNVTRYFVHDGRLGKSAAPTSEPRQYLIVSQGADRILRIDLENVFQAATSEKNPYAITPSGLDAPARRRGASSRHAATAGSPGGSGWQAKGTTATPPVCPRSTPIRAHIRRSVATLEALWVVAVRQ
jgi:hypothetical protein